MKLLRSTSFPLSLALPLFLAVPLQAQQAGTVTGMVTSDGSGLGSAQVVLVQDQTGAQYGGLTNENGRFNVVGVPAGSYTISVELIGYTAASQTLTLEAGATAVADFAMTSSALALGGIEVFAERAEERRTPVAFTDVSKAEIQAQLGSRDLPLVLNVTPSVYATEQGGGAGDARINVRGFSQRNTAVMINGVPVNDMENGWVYWSNWQGAGDVATSIQLQRGLSAVNLATPSIGGTLNVLTDPSPANPGYIFKQEFGSGNFLKTTMTAATGPVGDFSMSASGVRTTADGIIDGVWQDAWSFYVASQYRFSDRNRLEFYALGAPQRHGQRSYRLNIATLDREFAASLSDYDPAGLARFANEAGRFWSPNVAGVDPSYNGRQFNSSGPSAGVSSRYDRNFLNERENYFHKPQVNLNWYSYLGDGLTANTVAYYSGGSGGGTGTYGSLRWDNTYNQRVADWNATIARNRGNDNGASYGILRNSVNNQTTWGAIAKLQKEFDDGLVANFGVDWRTATIAHYREVRDLLGGTFYNDCFRGCSSEFWTEAEGNRGLGDKINYHNENDVNWVGVHLQAEKSSLAGSFYGMAGVSRISYDFVDFFARGGGSGGFHEVSSGGLTGYQVKGGAQRNLDPEWSVYGNVGLVSKVPIFDGVIDDREGVLLANPQNETFTSFEAGTRFRSLNRQFSFDANVYFTQWNDRTGTRFARDFFGENEHAIIRLLGMDARHMGIELEGAFQPSDFMRFDGALSFGDWKYTDDISGSFRAEDRQSETLDYTFYVKDLYVGDAPQFQVAYSLSVFPSGGFYGRLVGRTYGKHYANFDPFSRTTDAEAGIQSWRPPGYTIFDAHMSYRLPAEMAAAFGGNVQIFLHALNLLDRVFIQDAQDNSRFNAYWSPAEREAGRLSHKADDAEVHIGMPRRFNFGFQIYH
ncbi:MAG: TonB-dependent receptor [Gemmatimonadetes bacterium]|nr:TonB-dependent receptor [Gemmatimonadota bacterium]